MSRPDGDLRARTLRAAGWLAAKLAVIAPLQILYFMVLNRLIADPEVFGRVSFCLVILMLCETLSQTGLDLAVIRQRGNVEDLLHEAWSLQFVRGVFLAVLVDRLDCDAAYVGHEVAG